jgi:hypothetical protein
LSYLYSLKINNHLWISHLLIIFQDDFVINILLFKVFIDIKGRNIFNFLKIYDYLWISHLPIIIQNDLVQVSLNIHPYTNKLNGEFNTLIMTLEEIKKIISGYEGKQRAELVDFYYKKVKEEIDNSKFIDSKRIQLIQDVSSFVTADERKALITRAIDMKIQQIRSFILENAKENLSETKIHFSNISKWMQIVIKEISITFHPPFVSENVAKEFHSKLNEEFSLIFCSCEKFDSAGNQLLLDITAYYDHFSSQIKEKVSLYEKFRKNFLPDKALTDERIKEIYENIKKKTKE